MSNRDKFKIGDRVRVLWKDYGYYGKLGTVTGFDSRDSAEVHLDDGEYIVLAFETSLELVTSIINFDRNKHKDTLLAWINGSEIERYDDSCNTWWIDAEPKFETDVEYRVKRKVKVFKYKFAKMKPTYSQFPVIVFDENYERSEKGPLFIAWITDEITVEYPED